MTFNLRQYNSLQLHQKAILLGGDTQFLMNISQSEIIYSLYYFSGFYIEVLIDDESGNLIDIVAFKDLKRMEKYLDNIALIGF